MSKGLGVTQRAILRELISATIRDEHHLGARSVMELAHALGRGDRQIRAAIRALQNRGLVEAFHCKGPTGISLVAYPCYELQMRLAVRYGWDLTLPG